MKGRQAWRRWARGVAGQPGLAVALAAGLGAVVLGLNLGGYHVLDPNESKHAEIAREMFASGRWLAPTVNFEPYHDKPGLLYMLVSVCYALFGVSEGAARIVPAVAAWAGLLAVFVAGAARAPWEAVAAAREATRPCAEGLLAVALLVSCPFYVLLGRFLSPDALLSTLLAFVVLFLARWCERPVGAAGVWPMWVALGLAVLVKGPVALVLLAPAFAWALAAGEVTLAELSPWRGAVLALAIVALWVAPTLVWHPDYLADFLWRHNVVRYLEADNALHPHPLWFFVPVLAGALMPWSLGVPAAPAAAWRRGGADRVMVVFVVWVVVFFSLSSGKLATYIAPTLPVAAVLVARWLLEATPDSALALCLRLQALACALAPVAAAVAALVEIDIPVWNALVFVPAAVGAAIAGLGTMAERRPLRAQLVLCAATTLSLVLFHVVAAPAVGRAMSDADLAEAALAHGRPERMVAYRLRPYSFQFYTGWPMIYASPPQSRSKEYAQALADADPVLVLTKDQGERLAELDALGSGRPLEVLATNGRHLLLIGR